MKKRTQEHYQMTNKSIKVITFDLDDTFWDITPVIIRAEVETRKWIEQQLDSDIEWGNLEEFINLRKRLIAENHKHHDYQVFTGYNCHTRSKTI